MPKILNLTGNLLVALSCSGLLSGCTSDAIKPVLVDAEVIEIYGLGANTSAKPQKVQYSAMSMEELTNCGKKIEHLEKNFAQLEQDKVRLDKRKTEITGLSKSIDAAKLAVNAKNPQQVNAHDKLIQQRHAIVAQFNIDIKTYNKMVAELKVQDDEFNASCASRTYRDADYSKLPQNLRAAYEAHMKSAPVNPVVENAPASPDK